MALQIAAVPSFVSPRFYSADAEVLFPKILVRHFRMVEDAEVLQRFGDLFSSCLSQEGKDFLQLTHCNPLENESLALDCIGISFEVLHLKPNAVKTVIEAIAEVFALKINEYNEGSLADDIKSRYRRVSKGPVQNCFTQFQLGKENLGEAVDRLRQLQTRVLNLVITASASKADQPQVRCKLELINKRARTDISASEESVSQLLAYFQQMLRGKSEEDLWDIAKNPNL